MHEDAFAWNEMEKGSFRDEWFDPIVIPVIEHVPWAFKNIPIPAGIRDRVIQIIKEKTEAGVYEPTNSSYRSRWFCVVKKDGKSLRLVHSLEPLNAITIKDAAVPPHVDPLAESFAGRSVYSLLDLYVSFDQRRLDPRSRDLTAFQTPIGARRLTSIPQGWTGSVAVLQGDMAHILEEEIPHITDPYVDDVPIKGPASRYILPDGSYEVDPENPGVRRFIREHLLDVSRVIQRVKTYGGTFSGPKAHIAVPDVVIVGHKCTFEGRVPDESKVQKIRDWPIPRSVTEVRGFLGTCSVVRVFIKDFAKVARPLTLLLRKDIPFKFGDEELSAMDHIKHAIIHSPALRPIDYSSDRMVILAVDSSNIAVGFILLQLGKDRKRYPSRFGSITWNERESRYSQPKLELYGLFRALKASRSHIIGVRNLTVEVDAKYIKGMIANPDLQPNATMNRWIAGILLFDFALVHVPADRHTGADGLSRRPRAPEDPDDPDDHEDWIDLANGFVVSVHDPYLARSVLISLFYSPSLSFLSLPPTLPTTLFPQPDSPFSSDALSFSSVISSTSPSDPSTAPQSPQSPTIPRSEKAIAADLYLSQIQTFLSKGTPPDLSNSKLAAFIKSAARYFVLDDRLWRRQPNGCHQVIPPSHSRYLLLVQAHNDLGHKGIFIVRKRLLERFWWPMLEQDVKWFVQTCHQCQQRQMKKILIPPTIPNLPSLFRKAHIDTMHLPKSAGRSYLVQARCALSSWPEWRGLTKETGHTIAKFIFEEIICRWGSLAELVTDNGTPFVAALEVLDRRYGIRHIRISGYNSRANGIVERQHLPVREALMKMCGDQPSKWTNHVHAVFWAERVSIQRSTHKTPFYIVHGVEPVFPFDLAEATYLAPVHQATSTADLLALRARQLQRREEDLEEIRRKIQKARYESIAQFIKDKENVIKDYDFKPGSLVLVRNSRVENSHSRKSQPRYFGPYVIVRRTAGGSYVIAEVDGSTSDKRVAAFRLLPYFARDSIPLPPSTVTDIQADEPEDD